MVCYQQERLVIYKIIIVYMRKTVTTLYECDSTKMEKRASIKDVHSPHPRRRLPKVEAWDGEGVKRERRMSEKLPKR